MAKEKIILDCDPGHDDAIAIMVAGLHEKLDLLGISVVAGNQTYENVTNNALRICDYFKFDTTRVYGGVKGPLLRKQIIASDFHGETGLDGIKLPGTERKIEKKHAVNFIVDTLLNSEEKITLVPVGPLTNIAMALRLEPEIKGKIKRIVLMGGSCGAGNHTPYAEFNIYADPEAAHIVFSSGVPVVMMGLDVTNKTMPDAEIVNKIQAANTKASDFLYQSLHFPKRYTLHDVVTLAYIIDESNVELEKVECRVEIKDAEKYGQTVCSSCNCENTGNQKGAVIMAGKKINLEKFWNLLYEVIKMY